MNVSTGHGAYSVLIDTNQPFFTLAPDGLLSTRMQRRQRFCDDLSLFMSSNSWNVLECQFEGFRFPLKTPNGDLISTLSPTQKRWIGIECFEVLGFGGDTH